MAPHGVRLLLALALIPGLVACGSPPSSRSCPPATAGPAAPWASAYGGNRAEVATSVAITPDGELLIAGSTESFGAALEDVWILALGRGGEVLWQERFEGPLTESARSLAATRDGGSMVVAEWAIKDGLSRRGAILFARLDCAGDVLWARTVEIAGAFANEVRQTSDGGFLMAGVVSGAQAGGLDCLAVKLSRDGALEWQKAYGRLAGDEVCRSVALPAAGGYLLAGEYQRPDSQRRWSDIWLLKLDAAGEVEWQRTYGEVGVWERAPVVREAGDGSFLVSAYRDEGAWLLQVDGSGATLWQKSYEVERSFLAPADLWIAEDGAPTVIGTTRPLLGSVLEDVWAIRASPLGEPIWSRHYGRQTLDRGAGIAGLPGGGIVLAGTLAWGSLDQAGDAWVLSLADDGKVGSQGEDLPVTVTRLNVAPVETDAPTRVPPAAIAEVTLTVKETQAAVRSQAP